MVPRSDRPGATGRGRSGRAAPGRARPHAAAPTTGAAARTAPGRGLAANAERLRGTVQPVVEAAGYDLEDLSVSRAGRRSVLRVIVDGDEGVSLDAVAELSRAISSALDSTETTVGSFGVESYTLEVSSPGVDRPLTEPRHWRRNLGRLVRVPVGEQSLTGRIVVADVPDSSADAGVELDVGGARHRFRYGQLGAGKVQIEFDRPDSGSNAAESGEEES
jgi:ribosome maturation factor RimP